MANGRLANLVGGEWRESASGETYEKHNPWRPSVVTGTFAASGARDASAAVDAIVLELDEQTALFDIRKAFDPDAPQIHQWGNWYPHFEGEMDRRQIRKGNVEEAFDRADLIVQGVYRPAAIEHAPIETQVCQVVPEANGRLTIYSCTQALYFSMGVVAAHLQLPLR